VQPTFSDGHNTGIYSWDLLYELGANQADCGRSTSAGSPKRASIAMRR
jgi:DUF971 family protein